MRYFLRLLLLLFLFSSSVEAQQHRIVPCRVIQNEALSSEFIGTISVIAVQCDNKGGFIASLSAWPEEWNSYPSIDSIFFARVERKKQFLFFPRKPHYIPVFENGLTLEENQNKQEEEFNLAEWDARNQKRNERLADMPEGVNFRRQRLDRKDN